MVGDNTDNAPIPIRYLIQWLNYYDRLGLKSGDIDTIEILFTIQGIVYEHELTKNILPLLQFIEITDVSYIYKYIYYLIQFIYPYRI